MNQRGLALVEIVCVLAIMSILAAVVLPRLGFMGKSKLDYETACFVADLRWMQQRARYMQWDDYRFIAVQPEADLILWVNGDRYRIDMGRTLKEHRFFQGIRIAASRRQLFFAMDGQMQPPLTITLYDGNRRRQVIIDRVGRIRVERDG